MKISEVAKLTRMNISTIRYYEKSGLCPEITRNEDGIREFTANDVDWLTLLSSLRETGMPTSMMREFAELYQEGDDTIPERKTMLCNHRKYLKDKQDQLNRCAYLLSNKIARYTEILGKQT